MEDLNIDIDDNRLFETLGFKSGIEIHQQLATEKKLFCHCPVGLTSRKFDAEILRHMRPTLSELGEYDGTALMEFKTKKEVIYRLYRDRTCTYEMDDTPPFLVNQQALDTAIRIALLFNCHIVDEVHVIRKQYLDGSIPTGFQRTMIIGIDGWVPYKDRKINITQVNLEEEACREVSDVGHRIVFATDRLSIPLVEIITGSDMRNPTEAAEVCRLLGNSMKITGLVRRGIGTVRQDVNVSITGGTRVEIKGVYKVGNIKALTAVEAIRQKGLLELKRIFSERFPTSDSIAYQQENITLLFSGTGNIIGRRLESDKPLKVVALLLPNLADVVTYPLQPRWNFGSELAGRVKVIACIDSKPNLFFYSQREKYDIPESLWQKIRNAWNAAGNDDTVIISGPSADVLTAVNEIKIRISELGVGVVNETRQDMKDGTTDFERILPGPDRMYPDTDHPPVKIEGDRVARLRSLGTEPLWEKQRRWREMGLHLEQVRALSLSPYAGLFERLAREQGVNPKEAAFICTDMMTELRRAGYRIEANTGDELFNILKTSLIQDWTHSRLKNILKALAEGKPVPSLPGVDLSEDEFEKTWNECEATFSGGNGPNLNHKFGRYLTGRLLERFPGQTRQVLSKIDQRLARPGQQSE